MKKPINILVTIFGIVLCLLISLILVKVSSNTYLLVLGDDISYGTNAGNQYYSYGDFLYEELYESKEVNAFCDSYSYKGMTSKMFLEQVEANTINADSENTLKDYVTNAKIITISIGINDILSRVSLDKDEESLVYDEELLTTQIDILSQNLYQSLCIIKEWNPKGRIYYLDCIGLLKLDHAAEISEDLKNVCLDSNIHYLQLDSDMDVTLAYPTIKGQRRIADELLALLSD